MIDLPLMELRTVQHRAQPATLAASASAQAPQPQDIDALVAEELEISPALQSGSPEETSWWRGSLT